MPIRNPSGRADKQMDTRARSYGRDVRVGDVELVICKWYLVFKARGPDEMI